MYRHTGVCVCVGGCTRHLKWQGCASVHVESMGHSHVQAALEKGSIPRHMLRVRFGSAPPQEERLHVGYVFKLTARIGVLTINAQ